MGLREKQKTGRATRILDEAAKLFIEIGFEHVKAEEITERAELSVGTLYNYFGSKNEILMTLSALENEQIEAMGAAYQPNFDAPAADTLGTLLDMYFDPKNAILDKTLWRLGYALSLTDVTSETARRYRRSDDLLSQHVVELTRKLQRKGLLRTDLNCEIFGAALFNNANMLFFEFARSENKDYQDIRQEISDMTRSLVSLALATKNTE